MVDLISKAPCWLRHHPSFAQDLGATSSLYTPCVDLLVDFSRLGYREPKHGTTKALKPGMRLYGEGKLTNLLKARKENLCLLLPLECRYRAVVGPLRYQKRIRTIQYVCRGSLRGWYRDSRHLAKSPLNKGPRSRGGDIRPRNSMGDYIWQNQRRRKGKD